jgi:MinD-like ATPase involved in chromosome partitioning or flagellar assembly
VSGSVPVLTAITDPQGESEIVAALTRGAPAVHVVRRCVDLADLLAAAAAGLARAVVVSADLRRLDRDALTRLAVAGVAVVGLVRRGDDDAERRLRQLGVDHVLPADGPAADVGPAILAAVGAGRPAPPFALADPGAAAPAPPPLDGPVVDLGDGVEPATGRVVAVWGPTGAPGRSSVAVGVAAELGELGVPTLLVDADVYGGVVAQVLGLLDESPGLAAACRLANNGSLDLAGLAELAVEVRPQLRVLTGIARAERWPEVRPTGLEVVLGLARTLAAVTVVDCGFSLERDEELSFDTAAPRRNGATLTTLADADIVIAVAAADPVGLQRYVRALGELAEALPDTAVVTVVNRVRPAVVGGGDAEAEIGAALERFAGVRDVRFVPLDVSAFDLALAAARTLPEAAPSSPARVALLSLAASLMGLPVPRPRGKLFARRR